MAERSSTAAFAAGAGLALAALLVLVLVRVLTGPGPAAETARPGAGAVAAEPGDAPGPELPADAPSPRSPAPETPQRLAATAAPPASGTPTGGSPPDGADAAPTVLAGRVVLQETGEGVAGVDVRVELVGLDGHVATTDGTGAFELPLPGAATLIEVAVSGGPASAGMHSWERRRVSEGEREELLLRVTRGGEVRGRVVDARGETVAGAAVLAWCASLSRVDRGRAGPPHRTAEAGPDGSFAVPHLGEDFVLEAEAPGLACRRRLHGRLGPGAVAEGLELVLVEAHELEGIVLRPDGAPAAGVEVEVGVGWVSGPSLATDVADVYGADPRHRVTVTGEDGRFSVPDLAEQTYDVRVDAAGFPRWQGRHDPRDGELRIQLAGGLTLRGFVRGVGGAGLAGAHVRVRGAGRGEATTDEVGAFEVRGLVPDEGARLLVKAPGHGVHVEQPVVVAEPGLPVDVQLGRAWSLAGRVLDLEGRGVADAEVRLEGDRIVDYGNVTMTPVPTWEWVHGLSRTHTDGDGAFRFDQLYAGDFEVLATHPDDATLRAKRVVPSGVEDLELVLDPAAARGVAFVGTVHDAADGTPVPEFTVTPMVRTGDNGGAVGRGQGFEDPTGAFEVVGLDPAEISLQVSAPGYSTWKAPFRRYERGDHAFDVLLSPKRTLLLQVVDAEGAPLSGASVRFADRDGAELWVETSPNSSSSTIRLDEEGRGRAGGMPGTWIAVTVEHGLPERSQTFELDLASEPPGEVRLVTDWSLREAPELATLILLFLSADGEPEPGAPPFLSGDELARIEDPDARTFSGDRIDAVFLDLDGHELASGRVERVEGRWIFRSSVNGATSVSSDPVARALLSLRVPRVRGTLELQAPGHRERAIELDPELLERPAPWLVELVRE